MNDIFRQADDLTRRRFVTQAAKAFLGVSILPWAIPQRAEAAGLGLNRPLNHAPKARNVIYLYMAGGMTHIDTCDPKPGAETGGPTQAIKTNADGVQLAENLPLLANHTDKIAVVRGLTSTKGAHQQGNYFMHTSYAQRATIRHPSMGAWTTRLDDRFNPTLPGAVVVSGGSQHPLAGFLPAAHQPLAIGSPTAGLRNSRMHPGLTETDFKKRLDLSAKFDRTFRNKYKLKKVDAYSDMYADAVRLMKSGDLKAFDVNEEPKSVREAYGDDSFGQGVLLARRLVERHVRFVEVQLGGWDTHQTNFVRAPERAAILDQALSSLLDDLNKRGMLEETLVVVATEFGRTPNINVNDGRDHYPKAFSGMLAGGGIRGGQVWGKTDPEGREVIEQRVEIPDFNATIAYALGLPLDEIVYSPSSRPFTLADKGHPVTELL